MVLVTVDMLGDAQWVFGASTSALAMLVSDEMVVRER
jgi:hypothetical protein